MKNINLKGLDEVVYYDKCANGLEIYVWENKKANSFKASYVVRAGAEDINFTVNKKNIQIPMGTAHYLEHIMCKDNDNTSILAKFQAIGSFANASTYADKTVYECVGSENIKDNLNLLLDILYNKEFSEKSFASERGPILEEARMQKDNVNRTLLYGVNSCLFKKYHNKECGTGSISDINQITLNDLEVFYKSFYHPKNSFVMVTGNVSALEVIDIIKENQKQKRYPKYQEVLKEVYHEPCGVLKRKGEATALVETPRVVYSLKIPKKKYKDTVRTLDAFNIGLLANFSNTSLFKEELLNQNLIVSLYSQAYIEKDFIIVQIDAKSKYPEELIPILKKKMQNLEFNQEEIKRKVKVEIANLILAYEDVDYVNDYLIYFLSTFNKIIDYEKDSLESITDKKVKNLFKDINKYPYNIFVLYPENNCQKSSS